jgi:hypothetical protein
MRRSKAILILMAITQFILVIRSEIIEIEIETKIKTYSFNSNIIINSRILEAIRQIEKIELEENGLNNIFHQLQQWLMNNFNFNSFKKSRQTAYLDGLI